MEPIPSVAHIHHAVPARSRPTPPRSLGRPVAVRLVLIFSLLAALAPVSWPQTSTVRAEPGSAGARPTGTERTLKSVGQSLALSTGQARTFVVRAGKPDTSASGQASRAQIAADVLGPPQLVGFVWIASLTQTAAIVAWETDVPSVGQVQYGLTVNLGRVRPLSPGPEVTTHYVELSPLKANTLYHFRVLSTNDAGETLSDAFSFRTPPADASAKLIVSKTNSTQTALLPGACFDLYTVRADGGIGDWVAADCDKFDASPNDGKTEILAVKPGTYFLLETRSPDGYVVSKRLKVTLTAGQTTQLTVKDYRGGTRVTALAKDENGDPVLDACFDVWTDAGGGQFGTFVLDGCDAYDGADGATTLGSLKPGAYLLWQYYVPPGYVRAPVIPFTTVAGEATKTIDVAKFSRQAPNNVELRTVDGAGNPQPGACFSLYYNLGSAKLGDWVGESCDGWDGRRDGSTFFTDIAPGSYVALEFHAPTGFVVGKKTSFTKSAGRARKLTLTQTPGGVNARITTLKGDSSTKLRDACYGIYRQTGGRWEATAFWCDRDDGANDGVTTISGLTARTYLLAQTRTPAGYAEPDARTFTVGSSNVSLTVRTYSGASAASLDTGNPMPPTAELPTATQPTPVTKTPEPAATASATATEPATPDATATPEPTPAPTEEPSPTAEPTETANPTETATPAASVTPSPEPTDAPATETPAEATPETTQESAT